MNLVIKGTLDDAKAALQKHGLWDYMQGEPKVRPPLYSGSAMVEAVIPDDKRAVVAAWYVENLSSTPFPPGTLLHYTEGRE